MASPDKRIAAATGRQASLSGPGRVEPEQTSQGSRSSPQAWTARGSRRRQHEGLMASHARGRRSKMPAIRAAARPPCPQPLTSHRSPIASCAARRSASRRRRSSAACLLFSETLALLNLRRCSNQSRPSPLPGIETYSCARRRPRRSQHSSTSPARCWSSAASLHARLSPPRPQRACPAPDSPRPRRSNV